ncbi:hypothetical protein CCH79_00006112, partial [Gambusia affinis]
TFVTLLGVNSGSSGGQRSRLQPEILGDNEFLFQDTRSLFATKLLSVNPLRHNQLAALQMMHKRRGLEWHCVMFFFVLVQYSHCDLTYSVQEELKRGSVIGNIAQDLTLDLGRLSARKIRVKVEGSEKEMIGINLRNGDLFFVSSYNDSTLPADQTLKKSPTDFVDVFGVCDDSPENSKLTSYLIIALVSVSTFFLTFIIIILGVRFCRRRKPRLLFDGAVAIPGAYLPPNYADVDGTGTLRSTYNYDAYLTTGSRTSDFKFVSSYNDNTLPADQTLKKNVDGSGTLRSTYNYDAYLTTGSRTSDFKFVSSYNDNTLPADQTLKKSPSDFADVFGVCDASPECLMMAHKIRFPGIYGFLFVLFVEHCAHGELTYSVQEELKHGSVIANVARDLGMQSQGIDARKVRVEMERSEKEYIRVDPRTRDLLVAGRIDREEHCGQKPTCVLKFDLLLENPLELHRLSLQVEDINDNSPVFQKDTVKLEISESAAKGARYRINAAHDADIGQNAIQSYTLEQNPHFVFSFQTTSGGSKYGELVLDKELDREEQQELKLLLKAVDGGSPQRSGTVVIHVTVLDANDNAPVFTEAVYTASFPENAPLNTPVITVSAKDLDEGVNGEVTYEFGRLSDKSRKLFSLNEKTGEIIVAGELDYEEGSKYELMIEAKDGYGLSSEAKVIIDITDVNDNAPLINIKSLSNPIPENVSHGTEVGIINVQDRDSENNRQVRCSIEQNVPFKRKPRLLFDGAVAIPGAYLPPNYAEVDGTGTLRSTYNYDAYLTTGSRTSDFKFVSSYNDNTLPADQTLKKSPTYFADVFGSCDISPEHRILYLLFLFWLGVNGDVSYSVQEEVKRGYSIGNVAKDLNLDVGKLSLRNARVDAAGNRKRYCDINRNTGDLIISDRIDREELCGERLSCVIKREIVLENPLELHPFSLHVQDINDNTPQFNEASFTFEIRESADRGARFVIEEAHDADVGQNSVQQYSLEKNENFILAANGNTVELVLDKELDREKQKEINLLLTALDGGSPQRSGTVVIHVTVLDANDNAPVFSQAVYEASLPENSPVGTVVITVSATDADEGVNGDVSYDFGHVSENVKKVFGLDHKTGELKLISEIDFETVATYDLRIKAKDGLGLSSYTKVTVHVTDVNDNSPVIYLKSLANPIPENVSPGT